MSSEITLTEKQRDLVEKVGVFHEKAGLPPAMARVLGLLLVSPVSELSFDEIRETLNLSKSATSNALNMLLNTGKIDYITKSGDRKRYFKNKLNSWKTEFRQNINKLTKAADVLEEVLENRPKDTVDINQNLKDAIDFMRFINDELPSLYQKWEESRR